MELEVLSIIHEIEVYIGWLQNFFEKKESLYRINEKFNLAFSNSRSDDFVEHERNNKRNMDYENKIRIVNLSIKAFFTQIIVDLNHLNSFKGCKKFFKSVACNRVFIRFKNGKLIEFQNFSQKIQFFRDAIVHPEEVIISPRDIPLKLETDISLINKDESFIKSDCYLIADKQDNDYWIQDSKVKIFLKGEILDTMYKLKKSL